MASPVHKYFYSMVEVGVVKFFVDHQIFRAIPHEDNASVSYEELASKVGVELALLERLLNFLIAAEVLSAPAPGRVAHTVRSKIFMREDASRFYQHVFDFFLVSAAHWPEYFNTHGPTEPKYANRAPYGLAAGFPDKTLYEILDTMPQVSTLRYALCGGNFTPVLKRSHTYIGRRKRPHSTPPWRSPWPKCQLRGRTTSVGSRATWGQRTSKPPATRGCSWWTWAGAKGKSSRPSSSRMLISHPTAVFLKTSPRRPSRKTPPVS